MSMTDLFTWRTLDGEQARIEHPMLRQPVSMIVDDPAPGYNPAYFHNGFRFGQMHVPPTLIDDFADLIAATGMRGKFSVVPNPFGFGRVDQGVTGVSARDLQHFLSVTRERIAPYLDITPEVLTHWNAIDLKTGQLLPLWEHVWSRTQTRDTLLPYLSLALEILNHVDLPCSGMTSPWDFGDGVEQDYAEALLDAQKAVNGRSFTWYFLHMDNQSRHVPPRLPVWRPESGEAVVSIVCCDAYDFGRGLWRGDDPQPDVLITADGQSGRLIDVLAAGGPAAFHTHWQTIFGFGSSRGLDALRAIAERLALRFGDTIIWMNCHALAAYAAAAASITLTPLVTEQESQDVSWHIRSLCPSRNFTLSLATNCPVTSMSIDDTPLQRVGERAQIREGTFYMDSEVDRLYLCFALQQDQRLTMSS